MDNHSIEKQEFIEQLKDIEEVQDLKKIKMKILVLCISLILIIPLITTLGFYYSNKLICFFAGIVLVISIIYIIVNQYRFRQMLICLMKEFCSDLFNTKYRKVTISDEKAEDLCAKNNELFAINNAIEKNNKFVADAYEDIEHLTRFIKNDQNIDLFLYFTTEYERRQSRHFCNFVLVTDIPEDGILCIKHTHFYFDSNTNTYEELFSDSAKYINKILKKIEEQPKEEKYIKLTEHQKENLVQICNKYSNSMVITIKDGYLFIKVLQVVTYDLQHLKSLYDMPNCINDLLLNFI